MAVPDMIYSSTLAAAVGLGWSKDNLRLIADGWAQVSKKHAQLSPIIVIFSWETCKIWAIIMQSAVSLLLLPLLTSMWRTCSSCATAWASRRRLNIIRIENFP